MDIVFAIAALAGAIWALIALLRMPLPVACLVFVLVAACLGHPFLHFYLGPAMVTLDRLLLPVVLAAFVVQWRLGRMELKSPSWADLLLVGLLVTIVASILTNDYAHKLPEHVSPFWRLLAGYLIPALVYFIVRQSPVSERSLPPIYAMLTVLGLYLAVTGALEIAQQWSLVFPRHIADPKVGIHYGRARGPMVTAVSYGFFVTVTLLATLVWWRRFGTTGKLVLGALIPLELAAVYFSYTRSVWIGAAVSLVVLMALTATGRVARVALVGAVVGAVVLLGFKSSSVLEFKRESSASESLDSATMRASFAYVSWQMFMDRPLLGFGFGHFQHAKWPYLADRSTSLRLEAIRKLVHHNTPLSLLVETGVLGLGLYLAVLSCWARTAWRTWRNSDSAPWQRDLSALLLAVLGTYACQLVFHELSYSSIDNSLVFLIAGLATTAAQARPESASEPRRNIRFDREESADVVTPHFA